MFGVGGGGGGGGAERGRGGGNGVKWRLGWLFSLKMVNVSRGRG